MWKRLICFVMGLAVWLASGAVPARAAEQPSVSAASAILVEAESGRVLFEKNAQEPRAMASTTKIMTALLTLEQPDREITITEDMIRVEGSSMGLRAGDRLSLHGLAAGMLSVSGNDAANAAAIAIDGSLSAFAERMNRRAAELGLTQTHFVTPSGLDAEGHETTAADLARLMCYAMENESFASLCGSRQVSVSFEEPEEARTYTNHNKLLTLLEGCIGGKTGYTKHAGRCLVSAAERDGIRLVAVTLSDPDDWNDHMALMEYGFSELELYTEPQTPYSGKIAVTGGSAPFVSVQGEEGEAFPVLQEEAQRVECRVELPPFLYAPVHAGSQIGSLSYWLDGEEKCRVPLYAGQEITVRQDDRSFWEKIASFFGLNL